MLYVFLASTKDRTATHSYPLEGEVLTPGSPGKSQKRLNCNTKIYTQKTHNENDENPCLQSLSVPRTRISGSRAAFSQDSSDS